VLARERRKKRRKRPAWCKRDADLTPRQRLQKAKILHALSLARTGKEDLANALSRLGIDPKQALTRTNVVRKVRDRLVPKLRDKIPRSLRFYERGKLRHAEIANSKVASDIGCYWNAVGRLAETGKSTALRRLRRKRFKDMDGAFHTLEKDPKIILELEARRPVPELFEVYKR
jgi:hypothetical protein